MAAKRKGAQQVPSRAVIGRGLPRPRRQGLGLAVAALLSLLASELLSFPSPLEAASGLYEVQEVKPGVFAWIPDDVLDQDGDPNFSRAGTAGFVVTSEGVLVVDTTNSPFHARELLFEIRRRTDSPVRYVIDTDASGDHILGNEVFVDQQATLISSSAAQTRMRQYEEELAARTEQEGGWRLQARLRGFHVTTASQTFQGTMTLRLGGQEIRLISMLDSGDAAEEAAVYLPQAKVLFLGELYRNDFFPRIGTRDVRRWIQALRRVEGWDVDTYVPGHGAPSGKQGLADFRGFLEWLVARVEPRVRQGKSPDQIRKEIVLTDTYHWHSPELAVEDVEAVAKQLAAAIPAAPKATGALRKESTAPR